MNRLIVVGINSFYEKNGNGTTPHVVFQFQNIPVKRRMNPDESNAGGYPASEMREYLTPVKDSNGTVVPGSGKFLDGLKDAGVPKDVLWEPARVMATKKADPDQTAIINDLLWLPTQWEMFGISGNYADSSENGDNQVTLNYSDGLKIRKVDNSVDGYPAALDETSTYWLATAAGDMATQFCAALDASYFGDANNVLGVAPAFCVQGWPQP
jgi:hypothetical protein